MLASTLSRPRCAMPMTTSWVPTLAASSKTVSRTTMSTRRPRARSASAHVAGVEEALEDLGRVEQLQDVLLLVLLHGGRHALDLLLDPALLHRVLDVHVLDAERPAVGVAQDVEDLVERGHFEGGQPVGHEAPRQVPDGEPVGERVELGVRVRRLGVEGVEVGDEVAPHAIDVDQRLHAHLLGQSGVLASAGSSAAFTSARQRTGS